MVTIQADPANPNRLVLTATVSIYLDRLLLQTLSEEVTTAIRAQAVKDLNSNASVKKLIAKAATEKLLNMLGAEAIADAQEVRRV
jgi:hypothetical protein